MTVDLVGKRNKSRSVPMPSWAKYAVDAWLDAAGISAGAVFRTVNKTMTTQAVSNVVAEYADKIGGQCIRMICSEPWPQIGGAVTGAN